MNMADRIIEFRAKNGLNMQEMANLCKVSKQTIYTIENGLQTPSKITKAKIELVIGKEV